MNRRERRSAARQARRAPDGSGAATPAALFRAGLVHIRAGRLVEAQVCCQKILAVEPDDADATFLMSLVSLEAGQSDHAVEWFSRAIGRQPKVEYVSSLGIALRRLGRLEEASKAFEKVVQLKPDDVQGWNSLADVLFELKRTDMALLTYRHVLKLDPRHGDAILRCGSILRNLQRFEEALSEFNRCDELHPGHPLVLEERGLVLWRLKRFEEALLDQRRAHALRPGSPEICNSIGASLQGLRRDEEALPWFDKAIGLKPGFVIAWINKALSLIQLRRLDQAIAICLEVRKIDPDLSLIHISEPTRQAEISY